MPRVYKPDPRGKRIRSHDINEIENAIKDIKENKIYYRSAAKKYYISYSVLYRHATRVGIKKPGGQTALSEQVEKYIIENLNICAEWGYPLDEYDLRLIVKMYLDKKGINSTKFKNNFPGKDFALEFLKRHLSSHLSLDLIKKCKDLDIHFVFLPSNSTHLMQPLDVAFFAPLKRAWREIITQWKKTEGGKESSIPKSTFPALLSKLYAKIRNKVEQNLQSGFRKTGIHPINPEEVLSRLPKEITQKNENGDKETINESVISILKSYQYPEEANVPKKKKKLEVEAGKSVGDLQDLEETEKENSKNPRKKITLKQKKAKKVCTENIKIKQENALTLYDKGSADPELLTEEIIGNETQFTEKQSEEPKCMIKPPKCHMCSKIKGKENWLTCIACKNNVCPDCTDGDGLSFEFICMKCFNPDDSDDSVKDRDYPPSSDEE